MVLPSSGRLVRETTTLSLGRLAKRALATKPREGATPQCGATPRALSRMRLNCCSSKNLELLGKPFACDAVNIDEAFPSCIKTIRQFPDLDFQLWKARRTSRNFFEIGDVAKGWSPPKRAIKFIEAFRGYIALLGDFVEQVAGRLEHSAGRTMEAHFGVSFCSRPVRPPHPHNFMGIQVKRSSTPAPASWCVGAALGGRWGERPGQVAIAGRICCDVQRVEGGLESRQGAPSPRKRAR
jgi:hypothetical protein